LSREAIYRKWVANQLTIKEALLEMERADQ